MSLTKKHGERTYKMAWVVEISLFAMALSLAAFNLYVGTKSGSTEAIVQGVLLAVGWVGIACIELSTIPLAGSIALTRPWEKPINVIAVIGLVMLSGWTVYEFNESASYYMTSKAREAVIANKMDQDEIINKRDEITGIELRTSKSDERLLSLEEDTASKSAEISNSRDRKIAEIDGSLLRRLEVVNASIANLDAESKGRPDLVEKLDSMKEAMQEARSTHAQRTAVLIAAKNTELMRLERNLKLIVDNESEASAAFNSRQSDLIESLEGQLKQTRTRIDQLRARIAELYAQRNAIDIAWHESERRIHREFNEAHIDPLELEMEAAMVRAAEIESQKLSVANQRSSGMKNADFESQRVTVERQALGIRQDIARLEQDRADGPDLSQYQGELSDCEMRLDEDRRSRSAECLERRGPLLEERNRIKQEATDRREKIIRDSEKEISGLSVAYDLDLQSIRDEVSTRDGLIDGLESDIAELKSTITNRTDVTDSESEQFFYYRMAKWFKTSEGLPDASDYNRAQAIVFIPLGIFYGIVSIALAYIGTALRRRSSEEPFENREHLKAKKRLRRLERIEENAARLEERCVAQSMELVQTRQDAFEAIKRVPQVLKLRDHRQKRPMAPTWMPWVACGMICLVCLVTTGAATALVGFNWLGANNVAQILDTTSDEIVDAAHVSLAVDDATDLGPNSGALPPGWDSVTVQ